jgi:hypothetical protein
MRKAQWLAVAVLGGSSVLALAAWAHATPKTRPTAGQARIAAGPRVPVVVELFSSEGCSSCPPVDEYLAELDRTQSVAGVEVIALEQHVDYWDDLGWRDPFGSKENSLRQRAYSTVLADHRVFTPEMVVDGSQLISAYEADGAVRALQQAAAQPKARVSVRVEQGRAIVDVAPLPPLPANEHARVVLALTERGLRTQVKSGENAGKKLAHAPIVRKLAPLAVAEVQGTHAETTIALEPVWKPSALRVVAFVQLTDTGAIIGAASAQFSP